MLRKTHFMYIFLLIICSFAKASNSFVSDDLFTYVHSGPGTQYKIIGSVDAGEKITILQINKNAGYTQIRDSKGRTGWINSKYISKQASLKERLPKLEQKLKQIQMQLDNAKNKAIKDKQGLEESLNSYKNQVKQLQDANNKLNEDLIKIQAKNRSLNAKLDTQKDDLLMRWFTYGGMVAGAGLLLGLILPSLIPKRKEKVRW